MENINWDKLKPYSGDTKKSFEELCYQIVSEKFKDDILNGTTLTSIDDSGGGDGVEFYLTLKNGDVYGWQAKAFGRLSEGGRKEQIKKSLKTAYKKHPTLKKWYLCSKSNFTPDEHTWFNNNLENSIISGSTVLPKGHHVELVHWGESAFLDFLQRYPSINNFFFTDKFLTYEWFKEKYEIYIQKLEIKAKYEATLHTPTRVDIAIKKLLGGTDLIKILEDEIESHQVEMYASEYHEGYLEVYSKDVEVEYKEIQIEFRKFLVDKEKIVQNAVDILFGTKEVIINNDESELKNHIEVLKEHIQILRKFLEEYDELSDSELCDPIKHIRVGYDDEISKEEQENIDKENSKRSKARNILNAPLYALHEYVISSLEQCLEVFELLEQNELHISGEAGVGKTHISFNIYENFISHHKKPALFIQAKELLGGQDLESQLKNVLSVSESLSFDDFLATLEVTARIEKIRIPILIDGLNESIHWSSLWKNGLEKLILKIKKYPHLALITTYRTSYEDQLFPENYFDYKINPDCWKTKITLRGFEDVTEEAIDKYFDFYKLKLISHSNAMNYFEHPLHLKLFCETKNPRRQSGVEVSFQNEDLFEVFDEYILKSNKSITTLLKGLDSKYDDDFTSNKLLELSQYLWKNNVRGIPYSENLFTSEEMRIFEGENLLIFRDWNRKENSEEIQFTYDLLGGYFISKYLIKTYEEFYPYIKYDSDNMLVKFSRVGFDTILGKRGTDLLENSFASINKLIGKKNPLVKFAKSKEFEKYLLDKKTEHPLYDDILRTFSILLIKKDNIFLSEILDNERAKNYSTESLFEINSLYIKRNKELVYHFLGNEFKNHTTKLLNLSRNTELDIEHPLSFNFWSDLLKDLSMAERDKLWSEYIRKNHSWYGSSYFTNFVSNFEEACKKQEKLSDRVHIASKKIMWVFTTNIRRLRDEATRALYYYARRYPKDFLDLLKYSIDINDPYVVERMLAVTYGLAMARQNDFDDENYRKDYLPLYGRFLFDTMFSSKAKYPTTHILTRDYGKRTIDIALIHHSSLLTDSEKELIKYPFKNYYHKEWGSLPNYQKIKYRFGTPIHMDFENYTIGRLIDDRRNYDSEHNEYKLVLSQIYWRMYNLGYLFTKFGKIDKQIGENSWRNSNNENAGKIDRYGKKYSWIAFYEMAGYRSDLGLLKKYEDEDELRVSDADIDPSFPIGLREYNLFEEINNNNFLGNLKEEAEKWYLTDSDLDISDYIEINSNLGVSKNNDWLLLKGTISQKDKENQTRDVHIAINAILVNDEEYIKIKNLTDTHNDYTFNYLENVEDYYIYDGEIPWCDLIPDNYSKDFQISYNYHDEEKTKKELKILNNENALSKLELDELQKKKNEYLDKTWDKILDGSTKATIPFLTNGNDDELIKKIAGEMGYTTEYIDKPYTEQENENIEINLETTILRNFWESYHSEIISSGETIVPSKNISNTLELYLKPQTSDLYNQDGEIISTSFKFGEGYDGTSTFTYIKKDYLEKYLKIKNKKVMWLEWVEKRYFPNGVKKLSYTGEHENTEYRNYYKIIK